MFITRMCFFRFLPEDLQDMLDDIGYTIFEPTPSQEKLLVKYTEFSENNKKSVIVKKFM